MKVKLHPGDNVELSNGRLITNQSTIDVYLDTDKYTVSHNEDGTTTTVLAVTELE